ncbi:MAG TPA: hypothetical protein PLH19_02115 [Anaerolineae bacterium]|nr:hypothetical protein [Anaerolineae bacterium]HQH37318.1 hypothetical protein [Anaerolineae bacterium]
MKSWGVLITGLVLGLAAGLVYTWVISPPQYYDTYPPLLDKTYRTEWIQMTALAYGAEGNWNRTQLRLQGLAEAEIRPIVATVLEQAVVAGRPLVTLQRLAELAAFYGVDTPAVHIYTGEVTVVPPLPPASSPTPPVIVPPTATVSSPTATPSPRPTLTAPSPLSTPQPLTALRIVSQTFTCEAQPHITVSLMLSHTITVRRREQVEMLPLPGREVWLLWEDGADRAVTGFKPEVGLERADFAVEPGHVYKLYIDTPQGVPLSTIQVEPCTTDAGEGWVSRLLMLLEQE